MISLVLIVLVSELLYNMVLLFLVNPLDVILIKLSLVVEVVMLTGDQVVLPAPSFVKTEFAVPWLGGNFSELLMTAADVIVVENEPFDKTKVGTVS